MDNKTRRDFIVGAGMAAIGAAAYTALAPGRALAESVPGAEGLAGIGNLSGSTRETGHMLFTGLPESRRFAGGWSVQAVYGPVAGGVTFVLQKGERSDPVRVDLCLIGDQVKAPVTTRYFELYVMDGGGGEGCIDESLFEALEHVGKVIRRNERDPRLLEGILTFEERWDLYPDYMARAAIELEPGVERTR